MGNALLTMCVMYTNGEDGQDFECWVELIDHVGALMDRQNWYMWKFEMLYFYFFA